jgi:hypothetical protein
MAAGQEIMGRTRRNRMQKAVSAACAAGLILAMGVFGQSSTYDGPQKKLTLFTAFDFGRIESGEDPRENGFMGYDAEGTALNRTYVNVGFTERLDEHYLVSIGVGGIFWRAFAASSSTPDDKVIRFGPGISNAYMQWFPKENIDLTFGFFPYKYNDAARNLGEYLFRTEAYPTIVYTGGWSWINDAQYSTLGIKLTANTFDGMLRHDVGLFGEYFNSPIYDITPAYIATARPAKWLTVGGAAALHRYITPTPKTKKELTKDNAYRKNFLIPAAPGRPEETLTMLETDLQNFVSTAGLNFDSLAALPANANTADTVSFDLAAVKLMAFFEVDFNKVLGLSEARMGKFNLYGEIAQIGLKNYPIFYTESSQRRPMMLGFSVPTFGLLNNLSVETEYLDNPNIASIASTYDRLDLVPEENFRYDQTTFRYKAYNKDDLKWSVHASRSLSSFMTLYVQVANDHMRLKDKNTTPQFVPVTNEKDHWYWLARMQWAI